MSTLLFCLKFVAKALFLSGMSKGDNPKHRGGLFVKEPYYCKQKMAHPVEGQKAWCVIKWRKKKSNAFKRSILAGLFFTTKKKRFQSRVIRCNCNITPWCSIAADKRDRRKQREEEKERGRDPLRCWRALGECGGGGKPVEGAVRR